MRAGKRKARRSFGLISSLNNRGLGTEARILKALFCEHISDVDFHIYRLRGGSGVRNFDDQAMSSGTFRRWVASKDFVMTIETFMPNVFELCRHQGTVSIWRPNMEWIDPLLSKEDFDKVDIILTPQTACARLLEDKFSLSNVVNSPWVMNLPVREKRPMPGQTTFLFNAGRGGVGDRRNAALVIDAFSHVLYKRRDIHLTIKTQKHLDVSSLAKFGADQFRYICSNTSYKRNLQYYADADFSIAPSKWEGVGFALLESLYSGTPVLTVDAPPMNEWVMDRATGYLAPISYPDVELPIPFYENNQRDGLHWVKAAQVTVASLVDGINWLADEKHGLYANFNERNRLILESRKKNFIKTLNQILLTVPKSRVSQAHRIHLAIVEVDYHAEVLQKMVLLLCSNKFQISLFVKQKVKDKLNLPIEIWSRLSCFICEEGESVSHFLMRNKALIENADIVCFNTIERNFASFVRLGLKTPYLLCTHNINTDFVPRQSIDFGANSIFRLAYYLLVRVLLLGQWRKKRALIKNAEGILCGNRLLAQYLAAESAHVKDQISKNPIPYIWLPATEHNDYSREDRAKELNLVSAVVPGSVNALRKDYDILFEGVRNALPKLTKRFRLIFLGRPVGDSGQEIIKKFQSLEGSGLELSYFTRAVDSTVFSRTLRSADFILGSIKIHTRRKIYREIYGRTKISGIDSDIVSSQTPALINSDYRLDSSLHKVCEQYKCHSDLSEKLINWINNGDYVGYREAFKELGEYSYESVQSDFYQYCRCIVDKNR